MDSAPLLEDPITAVLTTYNELNGAHVDELVSEPSALEFMRYVALNRPFVVRGGAKDWKAVQTWDVGTLKERLEGEKVNVAVTPHGNADSPTLNEKGELVFVKPWEEQEDFSDFINYVSEQEENRHRNRVGEVRYAQTQNDNLRNEYSTLFSDVQKDIPWARIALRQEPEAINLWIGNSLSTTALHKDNYENIYVQIIGQKHFLLLPPIAYPCVAEQELQPASYARREDGDGLEIKVEDGEKVPFATWDPYLGPEDDLALDGDFEDEQCGIKTKYSHLAHPMRVTLNPGDMLYLPALWYHKVGQSCSKEGICCAVNYWHDMEFTGGFYPLCNFVRSVALAEKKDSRT